VASETISLSRRASRRNSKNGVSTDEELVSQNAHHFVEVAADVVDISDVKESFLLSVFCFGKGAKVGSKRCSATIPFWLTSWHRAQALSINMSFPVSSYGMNREANFSIVDLRLVHLS